MDYVVDWHLIYRNEQELFQFARAIPESQIKDMWIEQEPLGINYFLNIQKT